MDLIPIIIVQSNYQHWQSFCEKLGTIESEIAFMNVKIAHCPHGSGEKASATAHPAWSLGIIKTWLDRKYPDLSP